MATNDTREKQKLHENSTRKQHWLRWGPYLAERQWATVREDYSANGDCWNYFPHDHSRSRAYRWGEDGLLGFTDSQCRLCVSLALWNERDSILKERLFGLTNPEGNHGEDVKEQYFYLFSSPSHSYVKQLYKYPHAKFPYSKLVSENKKRTTEDREYELVDTGVFDQERYMDVVAEYAKEGPNDLLIQYTVTNRGPDAAPVHVVPQIWFRNNWTWQCTHEGCSVKPTIRKVDDHHLLLDQESLGKFHLVWEEDSSQFQEALFTENVTNDRRILGTKTNRSRYVKDAFHRHIVNGEDDVVNPDEKGTKAGLHFKFILAPGESQKVRLRLFSEDETPNRPPFHKFDQIIKTCACEGEAFYDGILSPNLTQDERNVVVQSYAGLLCSKQFYHYVVEDWLQGDPAIGKPPPERRQGRNKNWQHLYSRDIISMPDKWEYPWFAAWDLAFHMVPMAKVDPGFAKNQLSVFLREWYMHPNGQLPAYEFHLDDVNPPVHAWAARRVYEIEKESDKPDRNFLTSVFQKLLLNFTWWVNRKDDEGNNIFSGGFLGLDNISLFDRSSDVPMGGRLQQADGTAWMGFYCSNMMQMALELARDGDRHAIAYEDMASKFFEHFVQIVDAINTHGGTGLWDEIDGFYYDQVLLDHEVLPIKSRSLVGLLPLIAVTVIDEDQLDKLPGFRKRFEWFLKHRKDLARYIIHSRTDKKRWLISAVPFQRLQRILIRLLDPNEFLSPFGIRSLSKYHEQHPFSVDVKGHQQSVPFVPGESTTLSFGGNSNWRGPIWFPVNHLLVESLRTYHKFYGSMLEVRAPGSEQTGVTLDVAATDIVKRLTKLFRTGPAGRPAHGSDVQFKDDPAWKDLVLFYEYFHSETGRGLGASHQTGWTALVALYFDELANSR